MYVKPVPMPDGTHRIVRDPRHKRALPPEGGFVPDTTYWFRRINTGDVVTAAPPAAEPPAAERGAAS
jgi:hypothetical protein